MTALEHYCHLFARLRRAPGPVWGPSTKRRAPHKPLLLLSILDLVARGTLTSSFIDITGDLNELNELFTGYWRRVVPLEQKSSIAFPFSRLHNEPFWELVPLPGKAIDRATLSSISTVVQLRGVAIGARMVEELFFLIQQAEGRASLRGVLLHSCFAEPALFALEQQVAINAEAFEYGRDLLEKAQQPLVRDPGEPEDVPAAARNQGFRRVVVSCYDHRCALCGVRILTPEGHTAVDAAHIIPWAISHNDDIRNGMALCKLCHWAFDEGMLGVAGDYTVLASRQIGTSPNVPGFLLTLAGRGMIPPADRILWPAQHSLSWHRQQFRLSD